jgi:hypothetical protein
MKKVLMVMAAVLTSIATFAQGQVNFITVVGPSSARTVDAKVTLPDGSAPGAGYTAQLFLASGSPDQWLALTPATVFRTDVPAASFYVVDPGTPVTVPGFAPQSTAPLVLRAWDTASGSYASAVLSGTSGESAIANIVLGGGTLPPTNLEGLQGFQMVTVPEPSTIAFGLLGAGALLLRRRRK